MMFDHIKKYHHAACTLLVAMSLIAPASAAYATVPRRSTQDTGYAFSFAGRLSGQSTSWRYKGNSSPVYIYIKAMTPSQYRLYVDGASDVRGTGSSNQTVGGYVTPRTTGRFLIHSNVYESYSKRGTEASYARIRCVQTASKYGSTMNGFWSPDSSGSYPFLSK
jgi:hypothetical protein